MSGVLADMKKLENVSVRFSSDSVTGQFIDGLHGSVIVPTVADATEKMTVCRAYENAGKCSGCRACWDKSVSLIAYPAHGVKMSKVIKLIKA